MVRQLWKTGEAEDHGEAVVTDWRGRSSHSEAVVAD